MEFLTTDFQEKKLDAEINAILSTGIEVKKNISVGTDITLEDINKEYNAVYILSEHMQTRRLELMVRMLQQA